MHACMCIYINIYCAYTLLLVYCSRNGCLVLAAPKSKVAWSMAQPYMLEATPKKWYEDDWDMLSAVEMSTACSA